MKRNCEELEKNLAWGLDIKIDNCQMEKIDRQARGADYSDCKERLKQLKKQRAKLRQAIDACWRTKRR